MNIWTWESLLEAIREGNVFVALDDAPGGMRPLTALALSVAKWGRDNHDWLFADWERIRDHSCGLCMYWSDVAIRRGVLNHCSLCPLWASDNGCETVRLEESLWSMASHALIVRDREGFGRSADALYNQLVELYTAEYWRVFGEGK